MALPGTQTRKPKREHKDPPILEGTLKPATREVRGYRREHVVAQIQASTLINLLQQHVAGTRDMEPSQVTAAKIMLDRVLPTLQAAEVTHIDDRDTLTEEQIVAKINALLSAKPELLDRLLALRASQARVIEKDEGNGDQV